MTARKNAAWVAAVAVALLGSAGHVDAQDFATGLSAYNRADYETAVDEWMPLAGSGEAKAQAAMGFLFHKGLGVAQSDAVAAVWYRRAAEQGESHSQLFLGTLYFLGSGVTRDNVRAHMWCEIAITGGIMEALECREAAAEVMTAEEKTEARRLAVEWNSKNLRN